MVEFPVNPDRFEPYKNFKFRLKWDGKYVAGVSKVSALKRTTEVIEFRDGGDASASRKSPGRTEYDAITLERGLTQDRALKTGRTKSGALARRWEARSRSLTFARMSI
jgi:phage tail-like protein